MELVEGDHVSKVTREQYDQDTVNLIGHRIFTLMADQLFRFQCIHGDPHAGNFAYRPDGSIIMYDFGCVKTRRRSSKPTAMPWWPRLMKTMRLWTAI